MKSLVAKFEEAGLDGVSYSPAAQNDNDVGWILVASKP